MSRYQRMVVIPESEYLQLTTLQQVKQPFAQKFHQVNQEYENAASITDPYARLAVRSETLKEMKGLHDQMKDYLSISTPKPYRSRAERLFSVLEPHLKWNERGELMDRLTNVPINNSQVSDLIQHAVRDRRRNISPTGWDYFLERLREHNVPQMLLNMPTLNELKKPPPAEPTPAKVKRGPMIKRQLKRRRSKAAPAEVRVVPKRQRTTPKHFDDYFPFDDFY